MTFRTLIKRSLRFHWRAHLGVVLGAAIGSAALIGALVVGDSVKQTLRFQAVSRLPGISVALDSGDRLFAADLLKRMIKLGDEQARQHPPQSNPLTWGNGFTVVDSKTGLRLEASVSRADGNARAHRISLYGFSAESMEHVRSGVMPMPGTHVPPFPNKGVWLNQTLAQQLGATTGDELIFRFPKPAALTPDAAISPRDDATVALRLRVVGVSAGLVPPSSYWQQRLIDKVWTGPPPIDLSLRPTARPAMNAFMELTDLYEAAPDLEGKANFILASPASRMREPNLWERYQRALRDARNAKNLKPIVGFGWLKRTSLKGGFHASPRETFETITPIFHRTFSLRDAQLSLTRARDWRTIELKTPRIFLDPPVVRAALTANTNAEPILTYLVNLLSAGTNSTPYSMVTAAGSPWTLSNMPDDEIVVSQWLAEDLQVKPGDEINLVYFDPESGSKLVERTNAFRVHSVAPPERPWSDRTLMPDFPGIEKAESTSEWDAGFPLTYKVRDKDDDYWKQSRGTPKAFITLAAGQKMWGNRFGNLTAIRFPTNSPGFSQAALEKKILANLKPEELGLRFEPVREQALKAAEESQDFGGLFLGFSFFVIAAALLLMALLFSLGLEQRAPEIGTFLALGFTPKQVRKLLLREAVVLSLIGGMIGALGGLVYARAMLHGLTTIWRDAVGASALSFHFTAQTLVIGIFASAVVSVVTIWLTLRKFVRRPARELLVGEIGTDESKVQSLRSKVVAVGALLVGLALAGWAVLTGDTANAGIFFGAGALVLVAGLSFAGSWLTKLGSSGTAFPLTPALSPAAGERGNRPQSQSESRIGDRSTTSAQSKAGSAPSPLLFGRGENGEGISTNQLALRGCARRRKRSLATIAMLACGSFLIVSIGVFRLDANRDATKKTSGTGGFALIGETTMPVVHDMNATSGRDFFALNDHDLEGVNIVPFRVKEGDEASCLNLNRAQKPRLLGVKPEMLEGRFAFVKGEEWTKLKSENPNPKSEIEIPAIGDANSIQWAMGKKVGDTLDYVDERGQAFKVRIVGAVANSILQGQLLIDEAEFVKRFPGESGYRMFLLDAPSNAVSQVSATLSRAMQDVGLELTPAPQRLAQFNAVQNTYLGTFQVLGGLGLLLGSVGLGIVVLRNVLERRGELALLVAVGFRKQQLQRLLFVENGALLAAGLVMGVVAAAVAVMPALLSPGAELPYATLSLTLAAVLVNGALWTWGATRLAVRGDLLKALRNE